MRRFSTETRLAKVSVSGFVWVYLRAALLCDQGCGISAAASLSRAGGFAARTTKAHKESQQHAAGDARRRSVPIGGGNRAKAHKIKNFLALAARSRGRTGRSKRGLEAQPAASAAVQLPVPLPAPTTQVNVGSTPSTSSYLPNAPVALPTLQQAQAPTTQLSYSAAASHRSASQSQTETLTPAFEQSAENFDDVYYTVPIFVGGQELECVPDTGSFSILVISTQCTDCGSVVSVLDHAFDPAAAEPALEELDEYAEITFGSGAVHVEGGQTTVKVGTVSVERQKMWEIKQMDYGMQNIWEQGARFEGILGMGMADWVPDSKDESTFLKNAHVSKFGMCLGDASDQSSKIYWGEYPAGITYLTTPVVGKKHWAIQVTSFGVGNTVKPCDPCAAVVDSGTSSLGAPSGLLPELQSLIVDSHGSALAADCSNVDSLPDINIGLKGESGEDFTVTIPASWYVKNADNDCRLSLMTTPLPTSRDFGPVWLLGQPFIREYLVMYDRTPGSPTMSFARRQGQPGNMTPCPSLAGNPSPMEFEAAQVDHENETLITSDSPMQGEDILIHNKRTAVQEQARTNRAATIIFPQKKFENEEAADQQKRGAEPGPPQTTTQLQDAALLEQKKKGEMRVSVATKSTLGIGEVPFWTLRNFADGVY